ncbi:FxLYD domain-containing protein [Streptomyces sp. NPDC057197]|uniref:FxLYD domain-containing protein n=1 Tax=Streptomyces sp. NPDC057197 TaxID=3346045 RepID=UPI00362C0654
MPLPRRAGPSGPRPTALAAAALLCALAAGTLTGCGGGNDRGGGSATRTPSAPETGSFSAGTLPSALASSASVAVSSARASASAAASSLQARASEFEASVSADTARSAAAAEKALKGVRGRGNAVGEVGMTGVPRDRTGGVLAVLVTITNKTDRKASYAVQVDFADADGKVAETRYVGAQDLEPGKKAQPIAFSRQSADKKLTARLAKAQRY